MEVKYNNTYKKKGEIQHCNNYRGMKLLRNTMKVREKVVEMRMRRVYLYLKTNSASC